MTNTKITEVANLFVQLTNEYSQLYSEHFDTKFIDKQLWAALHLGFATGLEEPKYDKEDIDAALSLAQTILSKRERDHEEKS